MAGFFTRPDLSDIQFKQMSGSTLTMSGVTNFVGTLKSKGVEIDATLTGATSAMTGHVLTFIGNKIRLAPSTGGGGNAFDSIRITTRSGIPAVNVGGNTVQAFLEGYFFPSVPPSVSIVGGVTRMFGNNSGFTLNWTVTRRTLPLTSITVNGLSVPSGFFIGLPQNGSLSSGTTATINTPNTNQTYNLNAQTASESQSTSTSIVFSHKRYFYGDNQNLLDNGLFTDAGRSTNVNLHDVGGESEFASSKAKSSFAITLSSQFFYYVYPVGFGNASFTINGLSNTDFSFIDFTFTNPFGFATTFRMYRSNNLLNGTFNIVVS
jgi:hypothetical protein